MNPKYKTIKREFSMSDKRLTWNEICSEYPNQEVGLSDIVWSKGPGLAVESAIVKYSEKEGLTKRQIASIAMTSNVAIHANNTTDELALYGITIDD